MRAKAHIICHTNKLKHFTQLTTHRSSSSSSSSNIIVVSRHFQFTCGKRASCKKILIVHSNHLQLEIVLPSHYHFLLLGGYGKERKHCLSKHLYINLHLNKIQKPKAI